MWLISQVENQKIPIDPILNWISVVNNSYPFVGTLLALMAIDVFVGLIAGFKKKTLSSTISHIGMSKKSVKILLVAAGRVMEPYTQGFPVSSMIASAYIVTEMMSIIENAAIAGAPIPKALTDALSKFKAFAGISEAPQGTSITIGRVSNMDIHTASDVESGSAKRGDSVTIRGKNDSTT
jgi:toxin secretion/phage lysis holin